jgi:hypothetical protein
MLVIGKGVKLIGDRSGKANNIIHQILNIAEDKLNDQYPSIINDLKNLFPLDQPEGK